MSNLEDCDDFDDFEEHLPPEFDENDVDYSFRVLSHHVRGMSDCCSIFTGAYKANPHARVLVAIKDC